MVLRLKEYSLKAGDVRQIKIVDIEAPIRVEVVSGTFTYEVLMGDQVAIASAGLTTGVLTAPDGAWGSELRITCTGDGDLNVAHIG